MESDIAHWHSPVNTWSLKTRMLACAQHYIKLHYSQARKLDRHNLLLYFPMWECGSNTQIVTAY